MNLLRIGDREKLNLSMGINRLDIFPRVGDVEKILRGKLLIVFNRIVLRELSEKVFFLFVLAVVIHVNVKWGKLWILTEKSAG